MAEVTKKVVDVIVNTTYDDLPREVVHKAKNILLDSIGCALGGYVTERAKIATAFVREQGGNPQATIIGGGLTSASNAAFANGELINALDMDCIGPVMAHVIPYVLPPSLALSEMTHASGKQLLTSMVLAGEIGGRLGGSVLQHRLPSDEPPYYKKTPRYSFTPSIFGGVAGASKILNLEPGQVAHALGIGGVNAPVAGMMKWQQISGPSALLKYSSWTGWIAQLGTVSTLLAQRGFTSDPTIFDGEYGFWQMYGSPFFREEMVVNGLGETWRFLETEFKPYPNCRCNHGAIDGIVKLIEENGINPEDITGIRVLGDSWLLTPSRSQEVITNANDTQFSVKYGFAVAAYYGKNPGPHWEMPAVYKDPRVVEMMKKVTVGIHPRADELIAENLKTGKAPVLWLARVEIKANGKEYSIEVMEPWGKGENVYTDDDILRKFRGNATFSQVTPSQTEKIIDLVCNLEEVEDVAELAAAMRCA
ncbi:MAG: MmgE/PrpD family protein [Deltaproteobacteria bacterium]|nr:MmgE/PrpD family protein [Deltaproteobacteria bacterium]